MEGSAYVPSFFFVIVCEPMIVFETYLFFSSKDAVVQGVLLRLDSGHLSNVLVLGEGCDSIGRRFEQHGFTRSSFLELHAEWKSKRRGPDANIDERMTVLPGVFPVGCKLESESRATMDDGLQAVDEALSKQASVASRVPPSWAAARRVVRWPQRVGSSAASSGSIAVFHCLRAP